MSAVHPEVTHVIWTGADFYLFLQELAFDHYHFMNCLDSAASKLVTPCAVLIITPE